ncbi:hypothetical protein [Undibacter mobilis]|uniref:Uncharacterized protein n=1 Tax=Undibacter mobilis TaxID=2292256 RepID=A0A371B910_9BRAD|nr:hypothetical protein [Undibacter mobilis]RDV04044.1 hypothetical protein DXH78_05260 [Undibacter mobilis]
MAIARPLGFQVIALPSVQEPKPGLLRRLFDSLLESREQHAQKTVDAYVARNGSRLTDSLEREIGERLLDGGVKFRP